MQFLASIILTFALSGAFAVFAGSLTPSASPASTMYSLANIYDSIAGTFDSSGISATSTGSLIQNLKYISNNLFWASSTNNIYNLNSGNVGIGTSTPASNLHIWGDLRVNTSSTLGNVISGTWQGSTIGIGYGGTGTTTGAVLWLNGTTNQVNVSAATGTITLSLPQSIHTAASPTFASTTLSNFTAGSVPFFGTGGILLQNNSNLYWDNTNARLGIGTTTPAATLSIVGSSTISNALNVNSGTLFVDAVNSRVGIGTTTPNNRLQVFELINFPDSVYGTFLGYQSGFSNTTGNYNTGIGYEALNSNTTGSYNTGIGYGALRSNTTGNSYNTGIGYLALRYNTTGSSNTGIGANTLHNNITGSANTGLGSDALYNTTGSSNTGIGSEALYYNTTGSYNTGLGHLALSSNTTGSYNTGLGYATLRYNQTGTNNTIIGYQAGGFGAGAVNSFSNNTTLGFKSGYALSTGGDNILLGYQAGDNLTTGTNNILIGYDIDAPLATTSNFLSIGNLIFATGGFGTSTTVGTGNVGIGTSTPASNLHIWGDLRVNTSSTLGTVISGTWQGSTIGIGYGGTATSTQFTAGSIVFAGTNGVYSQNNSNLYWDNTNARLGIGTTAPGALLEVGNDTKTGTALTLNMANNNNLLLWNNAGVNKWTTYLSGGDLHWWDTTGRITFQYGGNVGIGEVAPGSKLSVSGGATIGASYDTTAAPTNGMIIQGNVGIGTTAPSSTLHIASTTAVFSLSSTQASGKRFDIRSGLAAADAFDIYDFASSTSRLTIASGGNVGIGTVSPSEKLEVVGNVLIRVTPSPKLIFTQTEAGIGSGASYIGGYDTLDGYMNFGVGYIDAGYRFYTDSTTYKGGDARFVIHHDGNVGIGTNTPTATLSVVGSSTISNALNVNSGTLFVDAVNSRVGIGTTGPRGLLEVISGTANTTGDGVYAATIVDATREPISTGSGTLFLQSNDALAADKGASIAFGSRYVTGSTVAALSAGIFGARENATSNNLAGYMAFYTRGAATVIEAMRINSAGNVGIGTTTPVYKLQVEGTTALSLPAFLASGIATLDPQDFLRTSLDFIDTSPTTISNVAITSGAKWRVILKGLWANNQEGGGLSSPAPYIELTDTSPSIAVGSITLTVSRNATSGKLEGITTSGVAAKAIAFTGTVEVLSNNTGLGWANSMLLAGNVGIGDTSPAALFTVGSGDLFQVISTGEARGIAGAVGAPSFSFTGDTNTGMYSGGADILRLATAGADRVTIDASGNVGIGTTTPAYKLTVLGDLFVNTSSTLGTVISGTWQGSTIGIGYGGTATSTQFTAGSIVFAGTNGVYSQNNSNLYWDNTNARLGIGTTTPGALLHLKGQNVGNRGQLTLEATDYSQLTFYEGPTTTTNLGGQIYWGATDNDFVFQNYNGGSFGDLALNPDGGNVGIGTMGPRALFSIVSGSDNANYQQNGKLQITAPSNRPNITGAGTIVVESNDAMGIDKGASIAFGGRHNSATSQGDTWGAIFGGKESATDAERKGYLALFTSPNGTLTERMRITSGGNVGIGTTTPSYALDVQVDGSNTISRFKATTGTNYAISMWQNTGGDLYVGRVASTNDSVFLGTIAYAGLIGSTGAYPMQFGSNGVVRMTIDSDGNVGIGTTTPAYGLVVGDGTTQKDIYIPKGGLCVDNNASGCPTTPLAGTIYASSTSITGIDLAENYPTFDASIEAGDVVSVDVNNSVYVVKSASPYQANLLGVISTAPGVLLGNSNVTSSKPVALAGRVPVKISAKNGEIKIGDLLTSSDIAGVAMKATEPGMVIGMALESFDGAQGEVGKVTVFVNPHWALGSVDEETALDQFTSAIKKALGKLGLFIGNGIAQLKEVIADKITTKELCVEDVCINKEQLRNLLEKAGQSVGPAAPSSSPPPEQNNVEPVVEPTVESEPVVEPTPEPEPEIAPAPEPQPELQNEEPVVEPVVEPAPAE